MVVPGSHLHSPQLHYLVNGLFNATPFLIKIDGARSQRHRLELCVFMYTLVSSMSFNITKHQPHPSSLNY